MSRPRIVRWLASAGHKLLTTPALLAFVMFGVLFCTAWLVSSSGSAGAEAVSDVFQSTPAVVAMVVVPVAVSFGISAWWRSRRRRAFRRLARERDWIYTERSESAMAPYHETGHTTFANDLVEGSLSGYRVQLYEFHWISRAGKDRHEHMVGVGVVHLPVALPRLAVVPEALTATLAAWLTGNDVDIENAEFNRRYRVRLDTSAEDETAARKYAVDVLNPRAVEALLATPPFAWRIDGPRLVGSWPVTGDTDALLARLEAMVSIAGHLPSFLVNRNR